MKIPLFIWFVCAVCCWDTFGASLDHESQKYGVLVDAGSSSTKIKVYSWQRSASVTSIPTVELIASQKLKGKFSELEQGSVERNALREFLQKIIDTAKVEVPSQFHTQTPIYILATAGLRLLPIKEMDNLVEAVKKELSDSSFNPFLYKAEHVQILSGEEEAVYAWIATNYLLGYFDTYKPFNESVGLLEMGGGSTQIAFIPQDELLAEEYQVTIANRDYSLYVQSYLLYGTDTVVIKEADRLYQLSNFSRDVMDPCRLEGDVQSIVLNEGGREVNVELRGSSNPEKCSQIFKELVKTSTGYECSPQPCAIGSTYQPAVHDMTFYATAAFVYTPQDLKAVAGDESLDINYLEAAAHDFCKLSLREAEEMGIPAKFASSTCLMGIYIPALLDTYGFQRSNQGQIKATKKLNGEKIDWALGIMLEQLSTTFTGSPTACSVKRR